MRGSVAGLAILAVFCGFSVGAADESLEIGNIAGSWPLKNQVVNPGAENPQECAQTIEHVEFTEFTKVEDTQIYSVDFDQIKVDDVKCNDGNPALDRMLLASSQPTLSALADVSELQGFDVSQAFSGSSFVGNTVSNFLSGDLANKTFLVGVDLDDRQCGTYETAGQTPYALFALDEDVTLVESNSLVLKGGEDHMVLLTDNVLCHYSRERSSSIAKPVQDTIDKITECFPSHATVQLESGLQKRMDEVDVGDRVQVSSGEYSDVFAFTHKLSNIESSFVKLTTESGKELMATPGHFIYLNGALSASSTAQVGDRLRLATGDETAIVGVTRETATGLFNPQTLHGDIVVNGICASTYTRAVDPALAHGSLAVLRAAYRWLGVSWTVLESGAEEVSAFLPRGGLSA